MATRNLTDSTDLPGILAEYAPLASPALTGTPTAPTPDVSDDSTKIATTGFVYDAIGGTAAPTNAKYITAAVDGILTQEIAIPGLAGSADRAGVGGANYANEFDSTTSGLTWSSAPAASDSHTTFPSHLYAHATDTTERYALAAYAPAGDFDARMKLGVGSGVASGFVSAGLVVTNSDNSARVGSYYVPNPGGGVGVILLQLFDDASQVGSNITINGTFDDGYLRITRSGTTIKYYYSANGKTWHYLNTATKTFTAAQIGLRFAANNSDGEVAVDWIRATG